MHGLKEQYAALRGPINERIQRVLEHGQYINGPEVRELEEALEAYTGAAHCIAVSSGTDALLISLMALEIGPEDEVIVPAFSFVAPAEAVRLVGARPVYVDVEPDTCNLDISGLPGAITERTKAIIPVSLYGQPCDMDTINAFASAQGLAVIEDAAQSFGATYCGKKSGNLSTIGCTSFYPTKPLGCYGDGGAIFTSDPDLADIARALRDHGQVAKYHHTRVGLNARLDTLQAAVLLAKLGWLGAEIASRADAAYRYNALLAPKIGSTALPIVRFNRTSTYAQYTIQVERRDELAQALKEAGIPTAVHYPSPIHCQPAYWDIDRFWHMPVAEALRDRVLSLPMSAYLPRETQEKVARVLEFRF